MKKELRSAVKKARKAVMSARQKMKKELGALEKSGIVSAKEAKQVLKIAAKEAAQEAIRIGGFLAGEIRKELKKAKPAVKKALARKKQQFAKYCRSRKN